MTDIVERLRQWAGFGYGVEASAAMRETAAEIEKPRIQREVWVNVYPHCTGDCMETKEMANSKARLDRIACVKLVIDCEEGEGL